MRVKKRIHYREIPMECRNEESLRKWFLKKIDEKTDIYFENDCWVIEAELPGFEVEPRTPMERIAEALERIADAIDEAVGNEFYHPTIELRDIAEALKGRG